MTKGLREDDIQKLHTTTPEQLTDQKLFLGDNGVIFMSHITSLWCSWTYWKKYEETQVKPRGQTQFDYLPRMVLVNIGSKSFCERTLSCVCINVCLWNTYSTEYDNLHLLLETSENRISKDLRDKVEVQTQEVSEVENT